MMLVTILFNEIGTSGDDLLQATAEREAGVTRKLLI
jgi:hypothetical protein